MRRLDSLFGVLAIALLSASLAGSASAGYWDVQYDLAPGSFLKAVDPLGGSDIDPITGTLTVRYDAATRSAPLSSAKLIQGHTNVQVYRNVTLSVVTGHTDVNLILPPGGTPGTLNGATLTLAVVADSSTTGYRHCYRYTAQRLQTGHWICLHEGMTHSVPQPQTPTGPGPFPQSFPKFVFTSGIAGTGDFTSTVLTQMLPTGAFTTTLYTTYVGREVSRLWHEPVPSISFGGLAPTRGPDSGHRGLGMSRAGKRGSATLRSPQRGGVAERSKAAVLKNVSASDRFPTGFQLLAGGSAFPGQVIRPHSRA